MALNNLSVQGAYHIHAADNVIIDPAWVLPDSCSHTLKSQSIALDGLQVFSASHSHDASGLIYNDTFSGSNGDPWAADKWVYIGAATTSHFSIQNGNGRLQGQACANNSFDLRHINYIYTSDFDIQSKISTVYEQAYNQGYNSPGTFIQCVGAYSTQVIMWWSYYNGYKWTTKMDSEANVSYSRSSGLSNYWMRIKKEGTTVTWYGRQDGASSWTQIRQSTGWTGTPPYQILSNIQTWTINPIWNLDCVEFKVVYPIGGMTLTTQVDLEIDDSHHVHTADRIAVDALKPALVVADAYHTHAAENIIIDPAWVYPADCYHVLDSDTFQIQAPFWIQFTDYTAETQPAGWTERWYTSHAFPVKATPSVPSEKSLLTDSFVGTIHSIFSWDLLNGVEDADILFNFYISTSQNSQPCFAIRGSGTYNTKYAYYMDVQQVAGTLRIRKFVNNVASTVASTAKALSTSTWYWCRFYCVGEDLKVKIWAEGSVEPAWDIETSDSDVTTGGWIGPLTGDFNNAYWYIESLSIMTGGGTANNPLSIWDSNHDLADDGPITVEEKQTLVVNGCYHTHSAEEADVYSVHEAYHSHVADNLELFSIHGAYHTVYSNHIGLWKMLQIAGTYHEHEGETITGMDLWVATAESYHEHAADAIELTLVMIMAIDDCYHFISDNDETAITLQQTLSFSSTYHEHVAENVDGMDISIQVAETYHAHDGPNIALNFDLTSIVEAYSEHVVDNVSLRIPLSIADCSHDMTSDAISFWLQIHEPHHTVTSDQVTVTITEVTTLVINDTSHFVESTTVTGYYDLDLRIPLLVNESAHSQAAQNCPITTETNLAVIESSHSVSSTNIEFNQAFLRVADCWHSTFGTNVPIIVPISIAESSHAMASEVPSFVTVYVMTFADSAHETASDQINLAPWLIVADSGHAHTADLVAITQDCWLDIDADNYHILVSDNIRFHALPGHGIKYTYVTKWRP